MPDIENIALVLLGAFNPAIFQPFWFSKHGLVRDEEAQEAEIQIVRPELTVCRVGPFRIHIESARAQFAVEDSGQQAPLIVLVSSVFRVLGETPIEAFGVNRSAHFRVGSKEAMDRIGVRLAPPDPWTACLADPEMLRVVMQGRREGSVGVIRATVEPSAQIQPGVYIACNEHFTVEDRTARQALKLLDQNADGALAHARRLSDHVLNLGSGSAE